MLQPILATAMEAVAIGLGAAAVLILIGVLILRWYRFKQEFALMRMAIEKGITHFPQPPPQWLLSLRQGLMIATLGVGLAVAGAIGWQLANQVPQPTPSVTTAPTVDPPRPPRPPDPVRDAPIRQWERAQEQIIVCMIMIGGGFILVLLGVVRLSLVPLEKKHLARHTSQGQEINP